MKDKATLQLVRPAGRLNFQGAEICLAFERAARCVFKTREFIVGEQIDDLFFVRSGEAAQ
jgi:hypothetical protein